MALFIATLSSCLNIQSSNLTLIFLPLKGINKLYSNLNADPEATPLATPTTSGALPSYLF